MKFAFFGIKFTFFEKAKPKAEPKRKAPKEKTEHSAPARFKGRRKGTRQ